MTFQTLVELGSCATDQEEYWYHVAPQQEMPLAGVARPPRLLAELDKIYPTSDSYVPGSLSLEVIAQWVYERPLLALELRLVLSLSDKRFYLDLSYLFSRELVPAVEPATTICGCLPQTMKKHSTKALLGMVSKGTVARRRAAAHAIARYLVGRGLLGVLDLYFGLDQVRRTSINDLWLAPHDVQQNETKRRGHGAEAEIAQAFQAAGLAIEPPNKASDPMGAPDPNVSLTSFTITSRVAGETISSDIAVLTEEGNLQIIVMGLVQSSDPGQFGVDKAATNGRIRERLDEFRATTRSTLEVWGIVDGVGYAENPTNTIDPMLRHFDAFVQHHSAYKAVLGAARLGLCTVLAVRYDSSFYSETTAKQMHLKYGGTALFLSNGDTPPANGSPLTAGKATLWMA